MPSWLGPALALGGGVLSGKKGSKRADRSAEEAIATLSQYWDQAQQQYQELFGQALGALAEGEAEASDEILQGLGLSLEERTKFFDIAKDNLDWVVDFGKEGAEHANAFLDHYSELIFNPDAIYDTKVYKGLKDRTIEEWSNFYSGKGLLGGNAQEAMVERLSELGYNFLQGERDAALKGHNSALNQAGLGAQASSQVADLAFRTGDANANDIMQAYTNLASITQGFNPASLLMQGAEFLGGGTANLGNAIANAQLAGGLGQSNQLGGLGNALITAGLGGFFNQPSAPSGVDFSGNNLLPALMGRQLMTQSTYRDDGPRVPGPHQYWADSLFS